ncbi:helix-turn-helix domain-containing protein [Rhodococcus sp. JS3073]|uniref:helix-turn-helix domain-containing protein n=1 Tax=Rhodococcus sp. JS3073 TaxID=3002901 RepID=UPI002285CE1D|nr:helix-turn-helix domain-containing protein [Rhodococcus sp. JS3073]WAM19285.1 helix-turn-helix domain-containing protein [Rhodococcus sp. JS3073]
MVSAPARPQCATARGNAPGVPGKSRIHTPTRLLTRRKCHGHTLGRTSIGFDATAAATIREHRLEACRQAMVAPRNAPRSLTDIATQFVFVELSVFSRAFTATHGTSPSRYHEQHR